MLDKSTLTLSAISAVLYVLFRFIEMRFILKENKPLKHLFRDGLLVFLSVFLGKFVLNQINTVNFEKTPDVFTNDPDF